jgi:hypothetical protein
MNPGNLKTHNARHQRRARTAEDKNIADLRVPCTLIVRCLQIIEIPDPPGLTFQMRIDARVSFFKTIRLDINKAMSLHLSNNVLNNRLF